MNKHDATVVGIDAISFSTPSYFLDVANMAKARSVEPEKYLEGIGQNKMAVCPPDEDIVTMAANAAHQIIDDSVRSQIDHVLFATESAFDLSKCAAIYVHSLLGLKSNCRTIEIKQACYSGTAALQLAASLVKLNPERKVLVLASDIARYEIGSSGEPTQGAAAVAMLVSTDPRILLIEPGSGFHTEDIMDFWHPVYTHGALVDGKYSVKMYLSALGGAWANYQESTSRQLSSHDALVFHTPFTQMARKAHKRLMQINEVDPPGIASREVMLDSSLAYNRIVGNAYTASMYISLLSLLETSPEDFTERRLGLFSYGSGCMAEFFSGVVQSGYQEHLPQKQHQQMLDSRTEVSYEEYLQFHRNYFPEDGGRHSFEPHTRGQFRLAGVNSHKRMYEKVHSA